MAFSTLLMKILPSTVIAGVECLWQQLPERELVFCIRQYLPLSSATRLVLTRFAAIILICGHDLLHTKAHYIVNSQTNANGIKLSFATAYVTCQRGRLTDIVILARYAAVLTTLTASAQKVHFLGDTDSNDLSPSASVSTAGANPGVRLRCHARRYPNLPVPLRSHTNAYGLLQYLPDQGLRSKAKSGYSHNT